MTRNQQREEISKAYIAAVAARCRFKLGTWSQDDGCLDVTIGAPGIVGAGTLRSPKLDIQLKCTSDGTIPLDDALRVRQARKQLLLAAAHSVVEPLGHFPKLSRNKPLAFLSRCREAPARAGSFISEVLIPVEPAVGELDLDQPADDKCAPDEPFAR